MKKFYIAPDMEELRFQALEAMADEYGSEFVESLDSDEKPF